MSRLLRRTLPAVRSGAAHPFASVASSCLPSSQAASSCSIFQFAPPAYHYHASATATAIATMSRLPFRDLLPGVWSGARHTFAATTRSASSRSLYTSRLAPPTYHTSATATATGAAAGAQSEGAAAAAETTPAAGNHPSPTPFPAARGRSAGGLIKFGALAAVAGATIGVGYASYACSINEAAEKTSELRKRPALLVLEDASTFEKYKAMVYSTAMKVPVSAIELYLDVRSTIEDHVRGFTEPTSDKLLPDLLPQDQQVFTLVLDLNETLVYSDWQRERGWRTFKRPGVDAFLEHMSKFYELVVSIRRCVLDRYERLKILIMDMLAVAFVLAIGYASNNLYHKLWGTEEEETDLPVEGDTAELNLILRTGKILPVFYQLGKDLLKSLRVTIIHLQETKLAMKKLKEVDMTRLGALLKATMTEIEKMEKSGEKTEKNWAREFKQLKESITEMKQLKQESATKTEDTSRVDKQD